MLVVVLLDDDDDDVIVINVDVEVNIDDEEEVIVCVWDIVVDSNIRTSSIEEVVGRPVAAIFPLITLSESFIIKSVASSN